MSNFDEFKDMPEDRFSRSAILPQVIDGDTLDVEINPASFIFFKNE
jgi:hypothetical protein